MALSHLQFVKLQHLLKDVYEDHVLFNDINTNDLALSEFNPLIYVTASGDDCLHIAAQRFDLCAIKLLIQGGVDINILGCDEYTPLDYALNKNSGEVVSYLI